MRDRDRQVGIDRASILQSDGGTKVAWGRIVLAPEEAAAAGYAAVKALNRYDCANRSFFTIKRVYLDARQMVLREESVVDQTPLRIRYGTVDERLWREVCSPPSARELKTVAQEAGRAATAAGAGRDAAGARVVPAAGPQWVGAARPAEPAVAARPTAAHSPAPAATPAALTAPARTEPPAPVPQATAPRTTPAVAPRPAVPLPRAAQWSYEGETGPQHWGRLRPEWAVCAEGARQSPIDLRETVAVDLEPVRFDYRPSRFRITDTGHTLQATVGEGLAVEVRGQRYLLEDIRFHRPSPGRMDGRGFHMAVHLHHRDAEGRMAIVEVMLERGEKPHPFVQTLLNSLPLEPGTGYVPVTPIDVASLMPASPAHFLYMGSLPTPPCTEGVLWVTMKEPARVSDEQLRIFARLYPHNSRPVQPLNGRLVLESR